MSAATAAPTGRLDACESHGRWATFFCGAVLRPNVSERTRAHVYVSGRVQGVFFRATTRDRADEVGVDGWVKNLPDGRVEAVFEGTEAQVEELVEFCRTGSPSASVEDVEVAYGEPEGLEGFEIRR